MLGEQFARYAQAERQLYDQASRVLVAIISDIRAYTGLSITEFRVTIDRTISDDDSILANCTIVNALGVADPMSSTTAP